MNAKKAKALRKLAREHSTKTATTMMTTNYPRATGKGIVMHQTQHWAAGTFREVLGRMKKAFVR